MGNVRMDVCEPNAILGCATNRQHSPRNERTNMRLLDGRKMMRPRHTWRQVTRATRRLTIEEAGGRIRRVVEIRTCKPDAWKVFLMANGRKGRLLASGIGGATVAEMAGCQPLGMIERPHMWRQKTKGRDQ